MNWKRREGDSTLPTRMTCDSMTQQMHPSICSLFAFATICTGEGGVPLLARARINFRRKEGVIQRWLSTGDAIYSGIETIKLIFPHSPPSSFQRYMQIIYVFSRGNAAARGLGYDIRLRNEFSYWIFHVSPFERASDSLPSIVEKITVSFPP